MDAQLQYGIRIFLYQRLFQTAAINYCNESLMAKNRKNTAQQELRPPFFIKTPQSPNLFSSTKMIVTGLKLLYDRDCPDGQSPILYQFAIQTYASPHVFPSGKHATFRTTNGQL
jgi:hypothetical protein